jgi:glutaredoxin
MQDKQVILVVAEGCPYCEEMKKRLPKDKVKVLDVTKDIRAAAILRDLGVYKVPVLVTVEKTEQGTELCSLDDKSLQVKCVKASPEATSEQTS